VYRKLYPAINRSIYEAGDKMPVFTVGDLTFGILICLDSNYYEPARIMASQGATALFVPTNNGLPPTKAGPELVAQARNVDISRAIENSVSVIRADVAGRTESLVSYGSSGIVDPDGMVLRSARQLGPDLIVADIETAPREHRRGWNASRNRAVMDEYVRLVTGTHAGTEAILTTSV
jgi:predicted amidohydrolase